MADEPMSAANKACEVGIIHSEYLLGHYTADESLDLTTQALNTWRDELIKWSYNRGYSQGESDEREAVNSALNGGTL